VPELKKRSGYSDTLRMITELPPSALEFLMFDEGGKAIHRFRYFADLIAGLGRTIRDKYQGDIRNMWTADDPLKVPSYSQLLDRIKAIKGYGDKTGTLLIRMLVLVHGVELFDGSQGLLPSDDRHLRRVGSRLGLWEEDAPFATICDVSRRLCPCCAAEMDALFLIGTDWCSATNPMCEGTPEESMCERSPEEVCPLRKACSYHRRYRVQHNV
jgi:endonuclease III